MQPLPKIGSIACGAVAALLFANSLVVLAQGSPQGTRKDPVTTFQFGLRTDGAGLPGSGFFRSNTGLGSKSTVQDYSAQGGPAQFSQPNIVKSVPRNSVFSPQVTTKTDLDKPGTQRPK